jgi:hypothetical protein
MSHALLGRLRHGTGALPTVPAGVLADDDAQLALHLLHELAYRGLPGIDPAAEEDPTLWWYRGQLHAAMEAELRDRVRPSGTDARSHLLAMATAGADGDGSLSGFVERHGTLEQVKELAIHRSAYQLKEADPHSWALPRLAGRAKRTLVRIQFDEYGNGRAGEGHAELFAATMEELGLDPTYGAYLDRLPGTTLATGNLISLLGSSRRLLPALVGHLALFEMCSVVPMGRYAAALRRLGLPERAVRFYDVHVVADAEHEVLALDDLVGGVLEERPDWAAEVCFGAEALAAVEGAFSDAVLGSFRAGRSSLLDPGAAQARSAS